MAEVNDEATNALIASMLAEDNHYTEYDAFNMGPDSEDDDWGVSRKKPKKGAQLRKSKGSKSTPVAAIAGGSEELQPDIQTSADGPQDQELTATGRRKRKDTGTNRAQSRGWSDEEEKLFLEALDLHGRDWKAAAAHVGSRDARAFTSHAQKFFIKLAIAGKPVPAKVAESGHGYTLSGKPLDPTSSAARAYGLKPEILERLQASGTAALAGLQQTTASPCQAEKENCSAPCEGGDQQAAAPNKRQKREPKDPKLPKQPKAQTQPEGSAATGAQSPLDLRPPPEPTEYAKNRPRRDTGRGAMALGHTTESLELVKCCDFVGPPGSGAPLAQPFQVEVDAQVHLMMDFHAHLSSCEIIGLLGGQWDSDRKLISIKEAFPCRRALGSHSGTSVELDPEAEVETRALMAERGLTPVGWYHSHPIFAPKPSQKDNENQRNYQALFRCDRTRLEPFIGAIVGPYDMQLPTQASAFTWFVVQTRSGDLTPYSIRHIVKPMAVLPGEHMQQQLLSLAETVKDDYGRMDLSSMWRPYASLIDGNPKGGPCSRADKLKAALQKHLPSSSDSSDGTMNLMSRLLSCIQNTWGTDLGMRKSCNVDSSHQEVQHVLTAVELDEPVLASSTSNIERCREGEMAV